MTAVDLSAGRRHGSVRFVAGLLVLALPAAVTGCSGGDGEGSAAADVVSATLEIITTEIEAAVGDDGFRPAEAGEELTVGDRVRTDDTGFAELTYHDGSWQRVENNATLTIEELTDRGEVDMVRTSVDVGRTWNRVQELVEPDDAYELETPVATASVRGTAFATDCPDADHCTFTVLEGSVLITPGTGDPLVMDAPSTLDVIAGEAPGEPRVVAPDVLMQDPWIARNLEEDAEQTDGSGEGGDDGDGDGSGGPAEPTDDELATASLAGTYDAVRTGVSTNYPAGHPNQVAPGSVADREYDVTASCAAGACDVVLSVEGDELSGVPLVFDGTSYVQRQELSGDCTADDGTVKVPGAARILVQADWTPAAAERIDGRWVVTRLTGRVVHTATLAKPAEFAAAGCDWGTTDGQPYAQEVTAEATRR